MTRAGLHNAGGGTCHLLLEKVVYSLVFLLGCQLPQHFLMLAVGSLCLLGTLDVFTRDIFTSIWLNLYSLSVKFQSSSLRPLVSCLLPPCNSVKIKVMLCM